MYGLQKQLNYLNFKFKLAKLQNYFHPKLQHLFLCTFLTVGLFALFPDVQTHDND